VRNEERGRPGEVRNEEKEGRPREVRNEKRRREKE
jgi:hypothetical protein